MPSSRSRGTPAFSAATMYIAQIGAAGELMVIEVDDPLQRQAVEQDLHVGQGADRDATRAELALGLGVVRVVAVQRRHVVGDRQAGLAGREQLVEALVRVLGGPEPGEHPHRPQPAAVAGRMDAPRERRLARQTDARLGVVAERPRAVQPIDREVADRREPGLAFGRPAERRIETLALPGLVPRRRIGRRRPGGSVGPVGHGRDSSIGGIDRTASAAIEGVDGGLDLGVRQVVGDHDIDGIGLDRRPDDHGLQPIAGLGVESKARPAGGRRRGRPRTCVRLASGRCRRRSRPSPRRSARAREHDERRGPLAAEVPRAAREAHLVDAERRQRPQVLGRAVATRVEGLGRTAPRRPSGTSASRSG